MMLHINGAIVVEGKYDKARLKGIVDCPVIVTDGFGVYKNKETTRLIRFYAQNGGIIILTDSDSAGFRIRGYIKGIVPEGTVKNAYIPDIFGKERRKSVPSAEGKLGVEGIPDELLIEALRKFADNTQDNTSEDTAHTRKITRIDLYEDGLSGRKNSSSLRAKLLRKLSLPEKLPASSLLDALNSALSYEEYKKTVGELQN